MKRFNRFLETVGFLRIQKPFRENACLEAKSMEILSVFRERFIFDIIQSVSKERLYRFQKTLFIYMKQKCAIIGL